ncbi:MAG TPA: hypothetical protein VGF59_28440, partial [Bryobacteraceae bacterium]
VLTGPMTFSLNGSISRVFRLGERRSVDLRFDATNALNHFAFQRYNTTFGTTQFGLPTGINGPRTMNATLRFRF